MNHLLANSTSRVWFEDAVPADQADAESEPEERPRLDEGLGHGGCARRLLRREYRGGPKQDRGHRKSKTANNTKSPTFNETFSFPLAVPELAVVTLEFWDDDTVSGDDYLGHVSLPVQEVKIHQTLDIPLLSESLTLWTKGGGQAFVKVSFDFEEA